MKELMRSPCSGCGGEVKRKTIAQEFEKEGVKVKLSGIKPGFAPSAAKSILSRGADKLVQAVNCLFAWPVLNGNIKAY